MNFTSSKLFAFAFLFGGSLLAQPAAFDFPAGCPQPTNINGVLLNIVATVDGVPAEFEEPADFIAVFNANDEIIGRSAIFDGFFNGNDASTASILVRDDDEGNGCATLADGPLTVRLFDASSGTVLEATSGAFPNTVTSGVILGPDGDGAVEDVFDFSATVFSVNLTTFTARPNGKTAELAWATSAETNNSHFEVERSNDLAAGFTTIGTVTGNGTTEAANAYTFADNGAGEGTVYYRLNQFDLDGTSTYSPVVSVEMEVSADRSVSVFPNPAASGNRLTLRLRGEWTEGATQVRMIDPAGRQVAEWTALGNGSVNTELPAVAAGIYQVVATDGKESRITRVVVR